MPEKENMGLAWWVAYIGAAIAFFRGDILQNRKHTRYSRKKKEIRQSKNLD